ncbi:hypothetical protein K450DRAFT_223022 [Umbelopsis ramanniana AG]|uniref:Uncharacterized protein n=1 Tax=Umbelopsis ramanniana AG TaxID=1314678 RepID=A0AAD5EI38_UMBRA|nr:uncharacterized protein K450DRAFT_223022 [Umbelopsis ramanniana AG]KAI8583316.1 hypothetical protein K450DRAFT_223022 [Umbelopsis ramanniana AG]
MDVKFIRSVFSTVSNFSVSYYYGLNELSYIHSILPRVFPLLHVFSKPLSEPLFHLFFFGIKRENVRFKSIFKYPVKAIEMRHCSVALGATKESESVTKDLEGKDATKPYNEGHGTASPDDVAESEAAFDTETVDPKDEMDKAGDKLDVSGANEKASPTPGNDD